MAPTIEPVSIGRTDMILVYLTQIRARMKKAQPKPRIEPTKSGRLAGLPPRSDIAPMDRARPKMRSESVCILGRGMASPAFAVSPPLPSVEMAASVRLPDQAPVYPLALRRPVEGLGARSGLEEAAGLALVGLKEDA